MDDKESDRHSQFVTVEETTENNEQKKGNNRDISSNSRITLYIILNGRVAFVIIGFLIWKFNRKETWKRNRSWKYVLVYVCHACKPVYEVRELQNEVNGLETAFV